MTALGPVVYGFFERHLKAEKGLSPASVRSYRDTLRLFLGFVADQRRRQITRLVIEDLTADRVRAFLSHLEAARGNHIRTRNQRLAALHTFFAYVAGQAPEMLAEAERVAAIPMKRVPSPGTRFLERDEIEALFSTMPTEGCSALRDRALLLFLYNTGARVQEAADLAAGNLVLEPQPRVNLRGKGGKWRTCPLWPETARLLRELLAEEPGDASPTSPVFTSRHGAPLTRFGIYKLVRRHAANLGAGQEGTPRRVSPHVLRHTTAVHLLEAGVEVNVIRGWLGHVSLDTTNRYAEINIRMKEAALAACAPPTSASAAFPRRAVWRDDPSLLNWLTSL
ncbi:MAG TPA: tyrosine-type recombinase/integrase [Rhodopseudomonas sp.]|uniref:tyrosine-type recombinase/integrase n=1 Tax=Rhodopseudomonas sp. TaxID=1078 RepID=UPI002EDA6A6E